MDAWALARMAAELVNAREALATAAGPRATTTAERSAVALAYAHGYETGFQADAFAFRPFVGTEDPQRPGKPSHYQLGFVDGYNTRHRIEPSPVVRRSSVQTSMPPPPSVLAALLSHVNWAFGQNDPASPEHQVTVMCRDWLLGFRDI
jgi:hypothetical protein